MKSNIFLLFLCFLIGSNKLASQTDRSLKEFYNDYLLEKVKSNFSSLAYDDITGSPYLKEKFIEGSVYMKNKKKYSVLLRFNLYESNFEFKIEDKIITIGNPSDIVKIEFDGDAYIYYRLNNRYRFVESIVSGKYSLICKKKVVLEKAEPAGAYKDAKPANFSRKKDQYYIINEKNEQHLVKNKKILTNVFADKQEEISKFVKKEKISHKEKADLKKLVEYYNSL